MNNTNGDWRQLRDNCLADMVTARRVRQYVRPLTRGQAAYLKSVKANALTVCTGPAGTGKTYVPCGYAAQSLREGKIGRVILTRPLVTCSGRRGKGMGFLPGDQHAKVHPFMRPMLDVLTEFLTPEELAGHLKAETVELIPLDLMRGLSIKNAFIVADEMQNADHDQWLMLLTRLGEGSRMVVSGDVTQSDLPQEEENALKYAVRALWDEADIGIVWLTEDDIVRHGLVGRIVRRWRGGQ